MVTTLTEVPGFAHATGHGPRIGGTGPAGGPLFAVVRAADAERGAEAPIAFLAEVYRQDGIVRARLLHTATRAPAGLKPLASKVIALPPAGAGRAEKAPDPAVHVAEPSDASLVLPAAVWAATGPVGRWEIIWNLPGGKLVSIVQP